MTGEGTSSVASVVRLGPVTVADAPLLLSWLTREEVRLNLGLSTEPSLQATHQWLSELPERQTTEARMILCEDLPRGVIVLDQINRYHGHGRIHLYLGERVDRGRGLGRAAIGQMLNLAFDVVGLRRVWLTVHERNVPALRCYLAVGFRVEGVLVEDFKYGEQFLNSLRLGISRAEWQVQRSLGE